MDRHEGYKKWIKILVGKHEWKRPFGGPRCRCEDNIKIFLYMVVWYELGSKFISRLLWTGLPLKNR
jgi:hypothetical protein